MSPPYISHQPTSDFKTQKEKSFLTAFEKPLKPDPYPPCAVPLKKLKRIYLKDLKSNTHNHGCYVVLRAFGEPVIKPIVINAIEDESGEVDRLAIHDMCEPSRGYLVMVSISLQHSLVSWYRVNNSLLTSRLVNMNYILTLHMNRFQSPGDLVANLDRRSMDTLRALTSRQAFLTCRSARKEVY
ncbi:hypothetical protein D6D10_07464 [Aureobasidium pullulans]|uniref:Uncharacterized protein n=1 Tax=Aureobasidium pullulans TaxID=5580 RepID=A0A4S9EKP2_AURPU|nr:hypothetical protein D6D10_07464 [Aureobasidium pullulans]